MEPSGQPSTPRRVPLKLADLVDAFEMGSDMVDQYLDLETGEVIPITDDIRSEMRAIEQDLPAHLEGDELRAAIIEAVENRGVPEWMDEQLVEAMQIEGGLGTRFIEIPLPDSRNGYADMELFIETVTNPALQERLWSAINGRGAFRRFKDALIGYPEERERWFAFKADRVRARVLEWLAEESIEPAEGPS
jgi:hypothetical protein